MQPWFVLLWYWTSMLWSIDTCQNKVSADHYHVTISQAQVESSLRSPVLFEVDRWPLKFWCSIRSRAHVRLTCWKQGRIVWKLVKANPGLEVNQMITFSSIQMLFCCFVLCIWWLLKLKTEGQTIYRKPHRKVTWYQNSTFSWVSLIGFWTTRPRSYAFRLA